jgi:hypothetical protein
MPLQGAKLDTAEGKQLYEELQQELLTSWPAHLPVLQETLSRLDKLEGQDRQLHQQVRIGWPSLMACSTCGGFVMAQLPLTSQLVLT